MPAQASGQQSPKQPKQRKHTHPDAGQQEEIPGNAPGRTGRWTIDQLIDFIHRTIGAQAPGVDQVLVEIEFALDFVNA
ncbi:hypothetical protein D3C87_1713940 [compost metagenome]